MDCGLSGRGCVVTGASRGIGRETARMLCAEGANVLLVARREDALREAPVECAEAGGRAEHLALDVIEVPFLAVGVHLPRDRRARSERRGEEPRGGGAEI